MAQQVHALNPLAGTPFGSVAPGRSGVPPVSIPPEFYAATHDAVSKLHGLGNTGGRLGHDLTLREALRNVTWTWHAAHRQEQIAHLNGTGRSLDFAGRLNTVMAGAVHQQLDGNPADTATAGFLPHTHKAPLAAAHSVLRGAAARIGLKTDHELLPHDKRVPMGTSPEITGHEQSPGRQS